MGLPAGAVWSKDVFADRIEYTLMSDVCMHVSKITVWTNAAGLKVMQEVCEDYSDGVNATTVQRQVEDNASGLV